MMEIKKVDEDEYEVNGLSAMMEGDKVNVTVSLDGEIDKIIENLKKLREIQKEFGGKHNVFTDGGWSYMEVNFVKK